MKQDFNKGIDFVIESDVGKLFLQVKSSHHLAREFRAGQARRVYNQYIALVVIDDDSMSDSALRGLVVSAVGKIRNMLLEKSGRMPFLGACS